MKKTIISITTAAAVMVSTVSALADVRAAVGGAIKTTSKASSDVSASLKDSASSIVDGSVKVSNTASDDISNALAVSGNLAMAGFDLSKEEVTLVLCSLKTASSKVSDIAEDTSEAISAVAKKVITTSGKIITSTMAHSQKGMVLSVHVVARAADSTGDAILNVYNSSKDTLIGTLHVSKNAASDLMDATKKGTEVTIDRTGHLMQGSSQVVGQVFDTSGKALTFVSNKVGDILTMALDESVVVIQSSANSLKALVQGLVELSGKSVNATSTVVKASLRGSVLLIKASGRAIVVIADDIERMTHSEK